MSVLHIGKQGNFPDAVVGFSKNIEVCFIGIITCILIIRRDVSALLCRFNIVRNERLYIHYMLHKALNSGFFPAHILNYK